MMDEKTYHELAKVLDTLPNGFPATESGVEMRLLKRIFRPEDAELFCDLRLDFETAEQIAARTGRPLTDLEAHLTQMRERGQIFGIDIDGTKLFKMAPWVLGIFELQRPHMDKEMAEMCEEFGETFSRQFFDKKPQLMQVIPIEKELPSRQQALPYEQISSIIESSQSFAVFDCVCKKEKHLLGEGCENPMEICMGFAPIPGMFDNSDHYRAITKDKAYATLDKAEDAGLVHLTWNVENGHFFICNCCGCCCGVLRSINEFGMNASTVINSYYYARIDPDRCDGCGTCRDERCQVNAIEEGDDVYHVTREKCIGCGLCVSMCPTQAISLIRKQPDEIYPPAKDELEWFEKRAVVRGVDISQFV
jgi:NAD-dependent dihydropyrimidine dehydrogenase PreA subunit